MELQFYNVEAIAESHRLISHRLNVARREYNHASEWAGSDSELSHQRREISILQSILDTINEKFAPNYFSKVS